MGLFYHGKRFHDNLFGKYFGRLDSLLKWGGCGGLVLNQESQLGLNQGKAKITMPFQLSNECKVANNNIPETAVALDEAFVRELYVKTNQHIAEIGYGFWCGELIGSLQDVIIAVKE